MKSSKYPRWGRDAFPAPAGKRGRRSVPNRQRTRSRLNPREAAEREAAQLTDGVRRGRVSQSARGASGKAGALRARSIPPPIPEPQILRKAPKSQPVRARRTRPPGPGAGWQLTPLEEAFFRAGDELSEAPMPSRDLFADLDEPE